MISRLAITEFLNRKLNDFSWIKEVPEEELDSAIKELGYESNLKLLPHKHQKASFYLCACLDKFMLILDMGLGKTFISLMLYDFLKQQNKVKKMLVIVPNVINLQNWLEEIEKITPYTCTILYGSASERQALLKQESDIYILNYEGLGVMMTTLQNVPRKKNKKRVYDPLLAKDLINGFDMIVCDEIHKARNSKSLTFTLLNKICEKTKYRLGLTGTPLGKDSQDLWSQFYLIDRGETLGSAIAIFRQAFYNTKPGYFGGVDYVLNKKKEHLLHSFLKNLSIYYADSECGDLPKQVFIKRLIDYSEQGHKEIQALKSLLKERDVDAQSVPNFYNKGRQISSGFIYERYKETEKIALRFRDNPKLDELQDILEDMPPDKKAVVFYHFEESGKIIKERLTKLKIKFNAGGGKTAIAEYEAFKKDKNSKVFVINIASGSTGLNLQNASYCIYYELTDNVLTYRQSLKRIHREGQVESRVYYYFLLTKNSVEEKIFSSLEEGIDISNRLIKGNLKLEDIL